MLKLTNSSMRVAFSKQLGKSVSKRCLSTRLGNFTSSSNCLIRRSTHSPHFTQQLNSQLTSIRYNSITASTDGSDIPESVRNLKIEDYHEEADRTLELIYCALDEFFAGNNLVNADVEESSGILEINFPGGSYVLNKQPPNKQLWLSSPVSGPRRFDFVDNSEWISLRDNVKLYDVLQQEVYDFVKEENADLEFSFPESF